MPRPRPPHLQRHKTRHGKFIWYVQIGHGPLIRIREEFGTPAFDAAYHAAINNRPVPAPVKAHANTLEWLWLMYRQSGAWRNLAPETRKNREGIMRGVIAKVGQEPLSAFTKRAMFMAMDARSATPFAALAMLKVLRSLFKWAASREHVATDPTLGVKVDLPKTKGHPEWTYEEIIQYENRWPLGTRERVMLDVYMYTGLRRSDAARVGKQHVRDGEIVLSTEKTDTPVTIPLLDALKRTLAAGPTGDFAFIVTPRGKAYTRESLGNAFKRACVEAGIHNKTAHGLRKAAAARAAEKGATTQQLMAIFGWTTISQAELYTRSADRKRLSREAIDKLEK
jgi:integrase